MVNASLALIRGLIHSSFLLCPHSASPLLPGKFQLDPVFQSLADSARDSGDWAIRLFEGYEREMMQVAEEQRNQVLTGAARQARVAGIEGRCRAVSSK